MNQSFSNKEKLKSKKQIEALFTDGQSVSAYPLRLVFKETVIAPELHAQVAVSVSKRHFKSAVDRNRIKRLLREAYRLNKAEFFNNITTQYAFMILYFGKEMPAFEEIEHKMQKAFKKFRKIALDK